MTKYTTIYSIIEIIDSLVNCNMSILIEAIPLGNNKSFIKSKLKIISVKNVVIP